MKKLFYIAFALGLASCSTADHDELVSSPKSAHEIYSSHRITQDEAVSLATSFRNNSQTLSRSGDTDESDVENVVVVRWEDLYPGIPNPVIGDEAPVSRGLESTISRPSVKVDTLFYIVNHKKNAGYTVVAADDRTDPIYAMIDNGNYRKGDWTSNKQTESSIAIIDIAVETLIQDMGLYVTVVDKRDEHVSEKDLQVQPPMLKTQWGHSTPMGEDFNEFYNGRRFHTLAVSVAQILSIKSIIPQDYPYDINWEQILTECEDNNGLPTSDDSKRQVVELISYLDNCLKNENWINSVMDNNSSVIEWFSRQNLSVTGFKDSSIGGIIKSFVADQLVCMHISQDEKCKYFVIDGYTSLYYNATSGARKIAHMPHCNWCFNGKFNGYFLGRFFDYSDEYNNDYEDAPPYAFNPEDCKYMTVTLP